MDQTSSKLALELPPAAAGPGATSGRRSEEDGQAQEAPPPGAVDGYETPPADYRHPVDVAGWRRMGYRIVDLIADYYQALGDQLVTSGVEKGFLRALLPPEAPEHAQGFDEVVRDLCEKILPQGLTHWQHPMFFGYFPLASSFPSMLGDALSSGLGVVSFQWEASPAATELEVICVDWLAKLLGLPPCFLSEAGGGGGHGGGVILNSASEGVLVSLLAAKARALHGRAPEDAIRLVAYASDQAHSCIQKACMIAGITHFRALETRPEGEYSLDPEALRLAIEEDIAAGRTPFFVSATIGTTSSCAVDPVPSLAAVAASFRRRLGGRDIWVNVDAAWAGCFAVLPDVRQRYFQGLEGVHSFIMNPHKGLLVNYGCSGLWVVEVSWVRAALAVTPEYLRPLDGSAPDGASALPDFKDYEVQLGGRFHGLKLWFVLRMYGAEGLRGMVAHRLALQRYAEALLARDSRLEAVPGAPPRFGLLCFRLRGGSDADNGALLRRVNATGRLFMVHTRLDGAFVLRLAIGGSNTQARHVAAAWEIISEEAGRLLAERGGDGVLAEVQATDEKR